MKKSIKKLTGIAAASVLAAGLLAGCGGSSSGTETQAAAETEAAAGTEAAGEAAQEAEAGEEAASEEGGTKTLRVAMECAYAPYNWTQPDDSNGAVPIADSNEYAYGYDVMMAKKICEELGWNLEIVRLDWDSLIPAVTTGQADCSIAGQSITSERLQAVDFSEPYYYATIVTLVKEGSKYENAASVADLAGATCTSQQSTIWYDTCLPQIEGAEILSPAESARPGPWRNEVTPYLVGIMDAFDDPEVEDITFVKCTQVGGTSVMLNMIGKAICCDPGPMMMVYPKDDLCELASEEKLQPMRKLTSSRSSKNFATSVYSPARIPFSYTRYLGISLAISLPAPKRRKLLSPASATSKSGQERGFLWQNSRKSHACSLGRETRFPWAYPRHMPAVGPCSSPFRISSRT